MNLSNEELLRRFEGEVEVSPDGNRSFKDAYRKELLLRLTSLRDAGDWIEESLAYYRARQFDNVLVGLKQAFSLTRRGRG